MKIKERKRRRATIKCSLKKTKMTIRDLIRVKRP